MAPKSPVLAEVGVATVALLPLSPAVMSSWKLDLNAVGVVRRLYKSSNPKSLSSSQWPSYSSNPSPLTLYWVPNPALVLPLKPPI